MLNRSYLTNFKQVIAVRGHLKVSSKLEKTFYDVGTKRNLYCAKVAMTKVSRKTSKRCLGQLLTNKLSINIETLCVKWIKYLHSTKQLKIHTNNINRPPKYLNWNLLEIKRTIIKRRNESGNLKSKERVSFICSLL